ncbi:MAG: hypothetical protein ACXAEN_18605 [Candidatus Thorarchaeota archaeon]|jgi:uncharacterized small protein (DUF1192 family)
MKFDTEAVRQQIQQHQDVIDVLLKQRESIDESIATLQKEIDKLQAVLEPAA